MIQLYKFIFYSVHNRYRKWGEEDAPEIYAIGIIVLLQGLLLSGCVFTTSELLSINLQAEKSYGLLLLTILMIANFWIIYRSPGKSVIMNFWDEQSTRKKRMMTLLMVLHFVLSIGSMVTAIVLRNYV